MGSWIIISLSLYLMSQIIDAVPPSAVRCSGNNTDCTVIGTYGVWPDRKSCKAAKVIYPKNEGEIVAAVSEAARNKMKMKVVSRLSHSLTKLVCPGGDHGLLISTAHLNAILVDPASMTATVDPGVDLYDFLEEIARHGLAFPASPLWSGLSMAGIITTGSHGSSLWGKGNAVHEYVTSIRLVIPASKSDGYSKVLILGDAHDAQFKAAKISLGVLGVISKITFQLQPMFKRSVTYSVQSDHDLEDQIVAFGKKNEFADVVWYPSQDKAGYRIDNRVDVNTPGDGVNNFAPLKAYHRSMPEYFRASEKQYESANDSAAKCSWATMQVESTLADANGLRNNGDEFHEYPVIGFQNKIQATGSCHKVEDADEETPSHVCLWDPRIDGMFFNQMAVSISLDKIRDFIIDVKKLRQEKPTSLCGIDMYNGFFMRYVKASTAFLGHSQDSVDVDISYYRSDDSKAPRLYQDVLEEIEQMLMFKYGGEPHWGKNRNIAFVDVAKKYRQLDQFLRIRAKLDPEGLFSSEWSDAVLGISATGLTTSDDHCAMEGMCICSEDRHCAPEQHYYCEYGLVYPAARVCRHSDLLRDEL